MEKNHKSISGSLKKMFPVTFCLKFQVLLLVLLPWSLSKQQKIWEGQCPLGLSWNHLFRQLFLTSTETCYSGLFLQLAIWQLLLSKDATDAADSFNQNWRFIFFVLWTTDVSSQSFTACPVSITPDDNKHLPISVYTVYSYSFCFKIWMGTTQLVYFL